jgi:hypothetical protein
MSISSQFYTGAEPSYFASPDPGKKSRLRRLGRAIAGPVATSLIVSIVMTVVGVRLLWQTPDAISTPEEVPAQKRMSSRADVPAAIQESEVKHIGRRLGTEVVEGERLGSRTAQLQLPPNPQLQGIILANPRLLPPFPTEHNVTVGTPRARLVRTFGKPDLSARTTQQQRVIETYVYEQQDRATIVQIQDGSVVSTYTGQVQQVRVLPSETEQ